MPGFLDQSAYTNHGSPTPPCLAINLSRPAKQSRLLPHGSKTVPVFKMSLKRLCTLSAISACLRVTSAHIQMSWPYPLRSPLDPNGASELKDYNMIAPLQASGDDYACKGYQYNTLWRSTASYYPGDTYNITLAGSATHGGGSCQISLSYNNGVTFKVIKSIIGGCPIERTYDFTVPSSAPGGQALLAWTWFNHEGNREMCE